MLGYVADYEVMLKAELERSETALREASNRIAWLESQLSEKERCHKEDAGRLTGRLEATEQKLKATADDLIQALIEAAKWKAAAAIKGNQLLMLANKAKALCVAVHEGTDAEVLEATYSLEGLLKGGEYAN